MKFLKAIPLIGIVSLLVISDSVYLESRNPAIAGDDSQKIPIKSASVVRKDKRMPELDDKIHEKIKALCAEGDALSEKRSFSLALKKYWTAWDLLPQSKTDWEAATWILAAIGDANFHSHDFTAGRDNLSQAMHCPGAIGNPFLHLRLGQCQYELGNLARAADELMRAYMGGGKDIFKEDDPKYFKFLTSRALPPRGGW
jgi:hypothetical protein